METNKPSDQEFPLAYNAYAAFDATSLKLLMQQRLNQNGVFTDQVFEGSNFNNLLDVVAYSYNVLLYYLNQTSNESLFSNVTLYENMNKIVKILNYNPIGNQTSILNYTAIANSNLAPGVYTIPRFSYFTINDIYYSFNKDLTFVKSTTGVEELTELSDFSLLYQGKFVEYPIYVANGENFEEVNIVSVDYKNNNEIIDHNNIYVYIRGGDGRWKEWTRVDSLYLENGNREIFEARFNENQRYTLKFGNNVTGKKLDTGSLIAIYYLKTDKDLGNVGSDTITGNYPFFYNTNQYNIIKEDTSTPNVKFINLYELGNISFSNKNSSTFNSSLETIDQIRNNAPNLFKTQGRLVTTEDISSYIKTNFSNIIHDSVVVNNWEYLDEYIRYLYNMGLKQPMLDSRVLLNQVTFSDSCNFNNLYVYCVPKILQSNSFSFDKGYLGIGLKDFILNKINSLKMSTTEVVFQDPVYYGVGLGVATQEELFYNDLNIDIIKHTSLLVIKSGNSNLSTSEINRRVSKVLLDYFSFENTKLGMNIDIMDITKQILNIDGIESIMTKRDGNIHPGLCLLGFNPIYNAKNEDIRVITQNIKLPYFKIPFWYDTINLEKSIIVTNSSDVNAGIREY
jgi:hypothetical protein